MLCSHTHSCAFAQMHEQHPDPSEMLFMHCTVFFLCVHSSFLLNNTYGLPSSQKGYKTLFNYFHVYIIFCGVAVLATLEI